MKPLKIAVRGGHLFSIPGASLLIDETAEDRKVLAAFLALAESIDYIEVLNCTPPEGLSSSQELHYGVEKANTWKADVFISLHFNNAYDYIVNSAMGFEMCVKYTNDYGARIGSELKSLGLKMRHPENYGQYISERNLYEIKAPNMTSIIVEPLFVESSTDVAIYNEVGPEGIAAALLRGITGDSSIQANGTGRWEYWGAGWRYLENDKYVSNKWIKDKGDWYYIGESFMQTGWLQQGTSWYYLYSNGQAATGWEQLNGNWYYFQPSKTDNYAECQMVIGWNKIDGEWYYLNKSGGSKPEGSMETGWIKDGSNWFYCYSNGMMAHDCTIDGWNIDSKGYATQA